MSEGLAMAAPADRPPPAPIAAPPAPGVQLIPAAQLAPSPLNPRKRFDEAALGELADSIATQGVLQNLVARPIDKLDRPPAKGGGPRPQFEIIAGERRWRAAMKLIADKRVPADFAMPVAVRPCTDLELLQLALMENVERNDLEPMEEADAFAKLVAMKQSTEQIAKAIGRTQRFVQYRLNLLATLHPKAQQALRAGAISVGQARALMMGPPKRQEEVLASILEQQQGDDDWSRPISQAEIKRMMRRDMVPVTAALFDIGLYKGPIVEDPDDEALRYFADVGAFEKLQMAELARREAEIVKGGAAFVHQMELGDVERLDDKHLPFGFRKAKKDEAAGAVIATDGSGGVKVIEGLVKQTERETANAFRSAGPKREAPERPEITRGFAGHARNRKTEALQAKLANDPLAAKRLLCAALISNTEQTFGVEALRIACKAPEGEPATLAAAVVEAAAPHRKALAGAIAKKNDKAEGWRAAITIEGYWDDRHRKGLKVLQAIGEMDAKAIDALLAVLVASFAGSWPGQAPKLGDDESFVTAARIAGVDMAKAFKLDDAFLAAAGKPQLLRIAADLGVETGDPAKTTAAKLRDAINGVDAKQRDAYLPPWVRIGVERDLQAILDEKPARPAAGEAKPAKAKPAARTKAKVSRGVVAKGKRK